MKKFVTKLMLLSTAALALLGSCGPDQQSGNSGSGNSTSIGSEDKTPSKIKHDPLPYVQENVALDLDKYITIEYDDNSTDHTYELTATTKSIIIDGHKIRCQESGTYYVTVSAGDLKAKLDVVVLSDDQYQLRSFLSPLEQEPRNFTVDVGAESNTATEDPDGLNLYWRVVHNPKYSVEYDPANPGALDQNGNPDSLVAAKLADGNGYVGHVEVENGSPKPVFDPGVQSNYDYYYIVMDLVLDASDSNYVSVDGEDALLLSASFAESLMWSVGYPTARDTHGNKIPWYGAVFEKFRDINIDGNPDIAVFSILVGTADDYGYFCSVRISNIGSSSLSWMETAVTDASYIPEKVTADEIPAAFTAANAAGNFTLTLEAYSIDAANNSTAKTVPAEKDLATSACPNLFKTCDAVITEKYTSDGIYTEFKGKKISQSSNGYTQADEYSLFDISAVYNQGGAAYSTRLDAEGHLPAGTAIAGETDVFTLNEVKQMAANNVTAAAANETNWTGKNTSGNEVTFKGDCGDNDGTVRNNTLFEQLLNMFGGTNYGVLLDPFSSAGAPTSWGTLWTEAQKFDGGQYHALSLSSDYGSFVVNTVTHEVEITFVMYAPLGFNDGYFVMKMTLSDIGTTTFDFSTLATANENPGILA